MIVWRRLPAWILRAWPVLALAPFFAAHALALQVFPSNVVWVHKIAGLCLQLLGGVLILWSVNDNLGLFRKTSLAGAFLAWLREFPMRRHHVLLAGTGVATAFGSAATLTVGRASPTTLEERVAELELQLRVVRDEMQTHVATLASSIEVTKTALAAQIQSTDTKIVSLSERVEKATVGGFKLQAFGVLLAIYGAVASVLA